MTFGSQLILTLQTKISTSSGLPGGDGSSHADTTMQLEQLNQKTTSPKIFWWKIAIYHDLESVKNSPPKNNI